MTTRRGLMAGMAAAGLAATSGCIGFLVGDEPATFAASKATASESGLAETGYEEESVEEMPMTKQFEAGGQTREVKVTNWAAQYHRAVDLGPIGEQEAAVFAVFSTPQVSVLGQTFNPVGRLSNAELVARMQSQYSQLNDVEEVDSRTVTMLGEETELTKFSATTRMGGADVNVFVHVTKVKHEDDHVIAVGVYPKHLDGEEENVLALVKSVEHAAEAG